MFNPKGDGTTVPRNVSNFVLIDRQNVLKKFVSGVFAAHTNDDDNIRYNLSLFKLQVYFP
jgi:hypothetical protein